MQCNSFLDLVLFNEGSPTHFEDLPPGLLGLVNPVPRKELACVPVYEQIQVNLKVNRVVTIVIA